MTVATSTVAAGASVAAVAASAAFLATMVRYRDDPTARPLVGVAVALLVGALVHLAVVDLVPVREALGIAWGPSDRHGGVWLLVAFDLSAVVSGFWFLFALQYTGRDRRTSPIAFAAVGALFALLVVPTVALTVADPAVDASTGTLNVLVGLTVVLAEALALVGAFLVLATTVGHRAFPTGQTVLVLGAVGAMLTLPFAATTLQAPVATPVAVTACAVLFTAALRRYRVFETLPVASVVGRERVIEEMAEGVVMVGGDGTVRGLNPEAEALLDVAADAVVGRPRDAAVPALPDPSVVADAGPTDVRSAAGRLLTVTADAVTDDRGRDLGHVLVCRDVTERRRREHRAGVLTQLLADVTQAELRDVADAATAVASGTRPPTEGGEDVHRRATAVATLVARTRDIERALASDPVQGATADVTEVVSGLDAATPADGSALPSSPVLVSGEHALLEAVLGTLASGAGGPGETPTVRVEPTDDVVRVDLSPFDTAGEDSLAGSALRLARLAAARTAWDVSRVEGTSTLRVTLPRVRDAAPEQARGEGA